MSEYIVPEEIRQIRELSRGKAAYFLAGGTDLMVMKKEYQTDERRWIDISQLKELKGIEEKEGFIEIGALTTMSRIVSSELAGRYARCLALAASQMGSPLIRNLATVGGNIANSNPAGDTIPALYALDAVLVLTEGESTRNVPADEFCTAAGENILRPGEIICAVKIPVHETLSSGFIKLGSRAALAISKVSVAAAWIMSGKKIEKIRIAMGAVGPKALRAKRTEILLRGEELTQDLLERAAHTIAFECSPIDDFRSKGDYRALMTGVLLKRILTS